MRVTKPLSLSNWGLLFGLLVLITSAVTLSAAEYPDPESYLLAAERLGLKPAECAVFEDSPVGAASARAAGMKVIGVNTGQGGKSPKAADRVVDDLESGAGAVRAFLEDNT